MNVRAAGMKGIHSLALSILLLCLGGMPVALAQPTEIDAELRQELLEMAEADQEIRDFIVDKYPTGRDIEYADVQRWESIDRANTARLKQIVEERGWPGNSLVGEDGANAAWLLAQHADKDIEFQKQVLPLIEAAVRAGDADPQHLAYLTDRVRTAEARPQVYGTQIKFEDGKPVPFPIEDAENVDVRRAEIGLEPMVEYLGRFGT